MDSPGDLFSPSENDETRSSNKLKKPPTVTPRRFRRFFTPRPSHKTSDAVKTSRRALRDITGPALNRKAQDGAQDGQPLSLEDVEFTSETQGHHSSKRRKLSLSSVDLPLQSSPLRRVSYFPSSSQEDDATTRPNIQSDSQFNELSTILPSSASTLSGMKIKPLRSLGTSAGLLTSRIHTGPARQRPDVRVRHETETAAFYSAPKDTHLCYDNTSTHCTMPFSTASCNTNSLIALGCEDGGIKLFDSAREDRVGFSEPFLSFYPHDNAVLDLEFSDDDAYLATASGDQTSLVIDMQTQRTIACLMGHTASLKQVKFQPGSNNKVLATCGRDGNIHIWDLRCHESGQVSHIMNRHLLDQLEQSESPRLRFQSPVNKIRDAHFANQLSRAVTLYPNSKRSHQSRGEVSVTSLCFLPSRPHLFISASESDATIKLWDLRASYQSRTRHQPLPLSTTRSPPHHTNLRPYGITSTALSSCGSLLYAACRDHNIYAYSTSHLVLGSSPDLLSHQHQHPPPPPPRFGGPDSESLGPLYAFRHPNFKISTFYIKLALRRPTACGSTTELLAAGSGDNCAVLFPTSERYTRDPLLRRAAIERGTKNYQYEDGLPIYTHGTPLVGGHTKEVTALSWNRTEGNLVSVSDDFHARCWREDAEGARELRKVGEKEGRRWRCGWAEVEDADWDEE
ncbi:MAG: hypothetical protein Q9227_004450 [Pyrenula ochraceoflavens]